MLTLILSTIFLVSGTAMLLKYVFEDEQTKKDKPNITLALKIINTILRPLVYLQLSEKFQPLDLEKLKAQAMKETNLTNFGDDWDETPYKDTIDIVNANNYSPVGKLLMHKFFEKQLKELLLIEETFRKEGASLQNYKSDVKNRPLFVLGLPRTGTTYLHSLLALDPKVRAPRKYELDNPSPRDTTNASNDKQLRIKLSSSNNLNAAKTFAPQMLQLHDSTDVTRAEECLTILSLFAPVKLITFLFPDHADVVFSWNWEYVYKNYWKILQMWEYFELKSSTLPGCDEEGEAKRWVLKCPFHASVMDSILDVIPNADMIWTHRNLDDNVLSCSNLKTAISDIFLDSRNLEEVGKGYMDSTEIIMKRADAVATSLKKHNPNNNKLIYCIYDQLIKNPINTIESIYIQLGYEFTIEFKSILENYIKADKIKRQELRKKADGDSVVPKKPTLETYGLTNEIITQRFDWCYEKYLNVSSSSGNSINDEKKEG